MKACRIGISWLPGQIPDRLVSCVVHSENIDHEPRLGLSSSNNIQSDLEPGIPSSFCQLGTILSSSTIEELITQGGAISIVIGDISKEKFALGANFKLEVLLGIAVSSRDKDLNNVLLP